MTMTRACCRVAGACVWLAVLAFLPASAQAEVRAGTSLTFPTAAFAGDTGLPASITLRNLNTNAEAGVANGVCNADDVGLPCATPEPGITLVPACTQTYASGCTPAGADPGVFAVSPTASGRFGSACAGMTFTTAIVDPTFGTVRFSPPAGTRVVLLKGTSCQIDFTVDVLKGPSDRNPMTLGGDIHQVTAHTQFGGPFDPASGSSVARDVLSFGTALYRQWPILTTNASPSATLGGQVSATATVIGRRNPRAGGTIDFRLYGPEDSTCTGAPVFESLGVPYPADDGTVTSQAFTPARAGFYRWLMTYSGDTSNFPAISMCNGANVIVRAPSPVAPPTCSGKTATIVAKPGQRSITGTAGADVIVGGLLGERIDGGGDDDTICAGTGDDIVRGGAGNDTIIGDGDQDRLFGDAGRDLLLGGAGNDDLRGGSGNDRAAGGDGTDRVDGGSGNDVLDDQTLGGNGRDRLFGGSGDDRVRTAGGGADRVDCGPGRGDSVLVDRLDRQTRCERVPRQR
jgi:hypothetical protein